MTPRPERAYDQLGSSLRRPLFQLQLLLTLALLLGGGGYVYGVRHLIIQLLALVLLGLNARDIWRFCRNAPLGLRSLVAASLALPLIQLVPLPPSVWHSLPGRDLAQQSLALAGYPSNIWMPLSLDRLRTLVAFCATIAPATIVVLGWTLSGEDRRNLALTLVVLAGALLLLGAVQLSSGNTLLITQSIQPSPDILYTTFSNRNSTAAFFVCAAAIAIGLPFTGPKVRTIGLAVAAALFLLAVVLTQSRTGMVLTLTVVLLAALRALWWWQGHRAQGVAGFSRPVLACFIGIPLALALALGASLVTGGRMAETAGRFEVIEADRFERWDDSTYVIDRYWPVGAGMGVFDDVFQVDESLEYLSPQKAGRAHNDYLEILIESGIAGPLLLLAWLAWCTAALIRADGPEQRWMRAGAFTALACLALQSVFDYPIRSQALFAVAAICVVLLSRQEQRT